MQRFKITYMGKISELVKYCIGYVWIKFFGWKVVSQIPCGRKFVLIGAPHTSNWDLFFLLASVFILRFQITLFVKDTLFKRPFRGILNRLGGIAINRDNEHGIVDQIVDQFKKSQQLVVSIAPSGTRKKRDYWKSGFYWIAYKAQVPIQCGYLDYGRKKAGLGLSFVPSGDIETDMDRIREFYNGIQGKNPELMSKIRLNQEKIL